MSYPVQVHEAVTARLPPNMTGSLCPSLGVTFRSPLVTSTTFNLRPLKDLDESLARAESSVKGKRRVVTFLP
jgi:hypothetical protein